MYFPIFDNLIRQNINQKNIAKYMKVHDKTNTLT